MRKCFKLYQVKFMLTHFMLREKCSNADRVFSGTYFPAFGLNTERYGVSLRIQSKCGKIQTRIIRNTNTFPAVFITQEDILMIEFKIFIGR